MKSDEPVQIGRLSSKGKSRCAALRLTACCLFATVALWLGLELIFSYFVASWPSSLARIQFMTMTSRDFIVADADRGFRLRANYDSPTIRTNSLGFRGMELPRDLTGKRLVLAVGESTTFGWAVNNDETYPSHLETILNATSADKEWVVVNAGVPSYSSKQVALHTEELLTGFHPEVVLVSVLWNDFFYSSLEDWTPEALMPAYPSSWRRALQTHSGIYRWLSGTRVKPEKVNYHSTEALAEYRTNLAKIIGLCRSKSIPVAFVEPPFGEASIPAIGVQLWGTRFSRKFVPKLADMFLAVQIAELESQDVPLIRHEIGLSERSTAKVFLDFVHPNSEGNRMMAESVAAFLQQGKPSIEPE